MDYSPILSTMLYSTLTNCPSMLGMAMRHTRRLTLSLPKLFSAAIILHPFLHIPLRAAQTASYLTLFYREREDVLQESSPGDHLFFIFFDFFQKNYCIYLFNVLLYRQLAMANSQDSIRLSIFYKRKLAVTNSNGVICLNNILSKIARRL